MTATPHIDPTTAGVMAAIEAGFVEEDWDQYVRFIEEGGVDPIHAVDVIARGINQQEYREAIRAGATHQEILELVDILDDDIDFGLKHYRESIEAGATAERSRQCTTGPTAPDGGFRGIIPPAWRTSSRRN